MSYHMTAYFWNCKEEDEEEEEGHGVIKYFGDNWVVEALG